MNCDHVKKFFILVLVLLTSSHCLLYAEENPAKAEAVWRTVLGRGDADFKTKQKAYIFFNNYGQRLYDEKSYKEAINKYNTAVSIFSRNSVSLVNRGNVFIALKSYAKAEEDFSNALRQKPSFLQALYGMGLVMYYGGNFPEAYSFFSRLLLIAPSFTAAKDGLSSVLKSLDPDFRLGVSELAEGSYRGAYSALNAALLRAPDNYVIARYAAAALFEMGLYKRAVVILTRKIPDEKLYPENTFLLGKASFMTGDYSKANTYFSSLTGYSQPEQKREVKYYVDKMPVLTSDDFMRAYKLFDDRDYRASLLAFENIASQPDTSSEVYFYIGKSYIYLNMPKKALLSFQKAIQLDANRNDFLFAAANALCMSGNVKLSRLMLMDILSTSPHYIHALKLLEKINTRDRVGEFFASIDTTRWSSTAFGNVSVEAVGESKDVVAYAARFVSFLEKKFNFKNSKPIMRESKTPYRIKIFQTKKVFKRLRDALGEEYMHENFIFYDSPVPGESFLAAYRESLPHAVFLKNLRHAVFHQYLRGFVLNPPPWLDEGLAASVEYVSEREDGGFLITANSNRIAALKMMFMAKQYYNLGLRKLLDADRGEFMANPQVYYQEAYAFCSSLVESSSFSRLMPMLRTYASGEENSVYIRAGFADDLASMDANFESYVMKQPLGIALGEGLALYKRGKWDAAISKFQISLDREQFLTENLLYLGLAFFKKKELDRAYIYFSKYMELERDRTSPFIFLAAIHKTRGETELFKRFLGKAEMFEPSNPLVMAMKRGVEAEKTKRTKLWAKPAAPGVQNVSEQLDYAPLGRVRDARVANNTGVYFFNSGIYDKAMKKFLEALAIQEDFPGTMYNLGVAYVFLGRNQDAIDILVRLSGKAQRKEKKVFLYLSQAYSQVNELEKAEIYLEKYKRGEEN